MTLPQGFYTVNSVKNNNEVPLGPRPVRLTQQSISVPRARILEVLQSSQSSETATMIAERTGLHHNTVREHLDALVDLGLVDRVKSVPKGRGRPSWHFKASDSQTEHDPRVREFAGLAGALSSYLAETSKDPQAEAKRAGRAWGNEMVERRGLANQGGSRKTIIEMLDHLGFAPKANRSGTSAALTRCPLLDVARKYPEVVCATHLGLVEGAMESMGIDSSSADLRPFSEPGACRLLL